MNIQDVIAEHTRECAKLRDICKSWEKLANARNLQLPSDYENFNNQADMHEQIATWLKELHRLTSLEYHGDTYKTERFAFCYHEMADIYTISIVDLDDNRIDNITPNESMSHAQFVDWCIEYERGSKNG